MRKTILLLTTHLIALGVGFGLGVYLLPILIAPDDPAVEVTQAAMENAKYTTSFKRDLKGSDAFHWAVGQVTVSPAQVAFAGEIAPGPDYKLYLTREFVDNNADFERIKASSMRIGEVKTFSRFVVDVPGTVDVDKYTTVVIWCERFAQFISAAQYRSSN